MKVSSFLISFLVLKYFKWRRFVNLDKEVTFKAQLCSCKWYEMYGSTFFSSEERDNGDV